MYGFPAGTRLKCHLEILLGIRYKKKCSVNAAQAHKAISQRHSELDDTERSDSSTIDAHLQTKALCCVVTFSRGKSALLVWFREVRYPKSSYFPSVCAFKLRLSWKWPTPTLDTRDHSSELFPARVRSFFFFLSTHVSSDFKSPLCSSAERRWTLWWKYSLHYIWLFFSAPFDLQLVLYCAGYSPSEESSIKGELQ